MKYRIDFAYNGKNFYGYAKQVGQPTVQETVERALSIIFDEDITIRASGRTDKGVHAIGQVATFVSEKEKDLGKLKKSLNSLLGDDIYILSIEIVPDDFDARFSAKKKRYFYEIIIGDRNPFENDFAIFEKNINFDKIVEICGVFVGKHCFKNFCSKEEDEDNFVREIYEITPKIFNERELKITFVGNGFMRYQIRKIVGTILEYQKGKITKEEILNYLNEEERDIISYTADPQGLYLDKVFY